MRVLGWKTMHRHNESEDVSLLSQEPARKHIVDMHSYHFFIVHLLVIIWPVPNKLIHHPPHNSTRQKLATTDKSSLLLYEVCWSCEGDDGWWYVCVIALTNPETRVHSCRSSFAMYTVSHTCINIVLKILSVAYIPLSPHTC